MKSDGERGLFYKVLGCVVCAVGLAAGVVLFARSSSTIRPAPPIQEVARPRPGPSLRCLFSDFTHANVVVGFEFAVALPKDALPQFAERGEAVRDDPAIDFDADQRPRWIYAVDDDGTPTITSPDEATRILLYGFKPGIPDGSWIEAGIRSNTFRNLDGKCLQAHFNDVGRGDVARSAPQ